MTALAFFYIVEEADYDCSGYDCPICACRHNCESIVQSTYFSDDSAALEQQEIVFCAVLQIRFSYIAVSDTLITRKVQLND